MDEILLKYGCNPNQLPAKLSMRDGGQLPLEVLNGKPGYINFMDALNAWQLVKALKAAAQIPAAASFKHVSPAGAALGVPLSIESQKAFFVEDITGLNDSPIACAYARARGADRLSSFGDFIALSDTCDVTCARIIAREVSDGIIAPGYDQNALYILRQKRQGNFSIIQIDPDYLPSKMETRDIFGITFSQRFNDAAIDDSLLKRIVTKNQDLPKKAAIDLLVSLITLKYTQSNSVCLAKDGQAIGIGAGQQSRVHCVRLAADKADMWHLRHHPKTLALQFLPDIGRAARDNAIEAFLLNGQAAFLKGKWQALFAHEPDYITAQEKQEYLAGLSGVSLGSDAFFPFPDSILRAANSGVSYLAQPGGSVRDEEVIACCDEHNMLMAMTGLRLFHH
ncbi:MAG: phosphoribosylaminoimidazolecarboxamide formyltransferase [Clostridiales bacterium]|nr:phosphoribosylaminoimidazolecarboxamide formyltransferase [Clostridiales bacterium]